MKVIYLLSLIGLMIAGCSSKDPAPTTCSTYTTAITCPGNCSWTGTKCQSTPTQCSDVTDNEFCSEQVFSGAGCYWTGSACTTATACTQPTTAKSCLGTSISGTGCAWLGDSCGTHVAKATCSIISDASKCQKAGCAYNGAKCVDSLNQCSDIMNQATCEPQAFASNGCYWNGTVCAPTTTCVQPASKEACMATILSAGVCTWNGSSCAYATSSRGCPAFSTQNECQSTLSINGPCYWTTKGFCATASTCSQLQSDAVCPGTSVGGKSCTWTPSSLACKINTTVECTLNTASSACCAGTRTSCSATDSNCIFEAGACSSVTSPKCTLNTTSPNAPNTVCCSGTSTVCSKNNGNCTFVSTAGACT